MQPLERPMQARAAQWAAPRLPGRQLRPSRLQGPERALGRRPAYAMAAATAGVASLQRARRQPAPTAMGSVAWQQGLSMASQAGSPLPDVRLWLRTLPDGTAEISRQRTLDAVMAVDAYSQQLPGTRPVRVGDLTFYAFVAPRLGADHFVVWRKVEDVRSASARWQQDPRSAGEFGPSSPVRVTSGAERPQLTAPVYQWENLAEKDPNRYWDDQDGTGSWMYWESFWAPSEAAGAASASPPQGQAEGSMLGHLLGAEEPEAPRVEVSVGHDVSGNAVSSTAIGQAPKDRAYAIVYKFNVWGSDVSRSGTGSDFWSPEARLAITALEAVIDRFSVRTMLDCACGDATWVVPYFVAQHPEIDYTGVDIVPEVIAQNSERYPWVNFMAMDLAETELPRGADLVFSKETLNHMDLKDAENAIRRFAGTGARYLLTNVHEGAANEEGNAKTCYTTYVHYDYELPPFNLRRVARVVEYQGPNTSFSVFELPRP